MAPKRAAGPFLALPSGSPRARSQRGHLERAYDDFISTGSVATLRPMVADSWRLSRASGVSPDGVLPSVDMLDAELEAYRSGHPLAAVMPLIRRLLIEEAEDAGAIVVVADADARLLWVEGDPTLRRLAEGMNWVAGSRWDERTTGTNAPAAAMRLDHALQVFAREHYASNVAAWSCTAAPDPRPDDRPGARCPGHHRPGRRRRTGRARAGPGRGRRRRDPSCGCGRCTSRSPRPARRRKRTPVATPHRSTHCPAAAVGARPGPGGADHRVRGRARRPSCRSGTPSCCSCWPSTPRATRPISWRSRCTSGTSRRSRCAPS